MVMSSRASPTNRPSHRVLLVTGLSGAGKTTVLHALEDAGWDTVDNIPVQLLDNLLAGAGGTREAPLAIGLDARTHGLEPEGILPLLRHQAVEHGQAVEGLFLDCGDDELIRRYNETRRRHPMSRDRSLMEGITAERALLRPLAERADAVIDTTAMTQVDLRQVIRDRFNPGRAPMVVTITSFGFARGMPPLADLLFDVRFLDNPHWVDELRELTGLDRRVGDHIAADPWFADTYSRILHLVDGFLPRYAAQGRSYVTVALGCTGGKHRSVYVAGRLAEHLRAAGFSTTVQHRHLAQPVPDAAAQPAPDPAAAPQEQRSLPRAARQVD